MRAKIYSDERSINMSTIPSFTNADFATRMSILKQLANVTGIRLPQTIIPEGESLIPYGEDRKRELKEEIDSLPTLEQAFGQLRDIRTEQAPMQTRVPLQRIRMSADGGGLYGKGSEGKTPLGYTRTAFNHVSSAIKPSDVKTGFASTLLALPVNIRSDAFNYFAERQVDSDQVVLRSQLMPARKSGEVGLRRSIYSVVSTKYGVMEDHDLVEAAQMAMPDGAKVRYTQNESRSDLEFLWKSLDRELKVGDIALIGIHITNSQTKESSIRFTPKLLRVLCLNFTTAWGTGAHREVSIRHIGSPGQLAAKLREAFRECLLVVEPFVKAFGDAYQNPLPEFAPTRGEAITHFIKAADLDPALGKQMANVWDIDGSMSAGNTLAGLANAATRVSQQFAFAQAEQIEEFSGRLIREGWDAIE